LIVRIRALLVFLVPLLLGVLGVFVNGEVVGGELNCGGVAAEHLALFFLSLGYRDDDDDGDGDDNNIPSQL